MRITNKKPIREEIEWDRPYLVRVGEVYFVSYASGFGDDICFEKPDEPSTWCALEAVDEIARIEE